MVQPAGCSDPFPAIPLMDPRFAAPEDGEKKDANLTPSLSLVWVSHAMWPEADTLQLLERQHSALQRALEAIPGCHQVDESSGSKKQRCSSGPESPCDGIESVLRSLELQRAALNRALKDIPVPKSSGSLSLMHSQKVLKSFGVNRREVRGESIAFTGLYSTVYCQHFTIQHLSRTRLCLHASMIHSIHVPYTVGSFPETSQCSQPHYIRTWMFAQELLLRKMANGW
jgi:hypothetical protein